jgi:proliferating cell nuclear antigen PCNA
MKIEIKPRFFSEIINIISQLVTEANLNFTKNGLSIIALDPGSVAMVIFEMPKENFLAYDVTQETLALSLDDLKQVLKRVEKAESIVLEKQENTLVVSSKDGIRRKFHLALINLEEEERKKPSLSFTTTVEIASDLLKEAIEDVGIVADSFSFISSKSEKNFKIVGRGTLNKSEIEFNEDEINASLGNDKTTYSVEYFEKFIKASKIFEKVRISYKTDHPCQLEFFNEGSNIKLTFILAPRIEE